MVVFIKFGEYKKLKITDHWNREDQDFTPWLSQNLEYLNDALGLDIQSSDIEYPTGSFSVDILALDENGETVIIENQYGKSNHDHLGKTLTYQAYHDAKTVIWICEETRPEHEKVFNWLNETVSDGTQFYLVQLELFQIDDSRPFPRFEKICYPSEISNSVRKEKRELTERQRNRNEFWELFEEKFTELNPATNLIGGRTRKITLESGALYLIFRITNKEAKIELSLESGDPQTNKDLFKRIESKQAEIEAKFSRSLIWNFQEGRKMQKIQHVIEGGGLDDDDRWEEIQEQMIHRMKEFKTAFKPYL
ncbi:MAG: DUF4268 domain-containing protein [Candidatus Lokiarchaeota archaeon]|nr:DUF4268 domain-containing protein [Candidatus Lokiarchaeota archaeon]